MTEIVTRLRLRLDCFTGLHPVMVHKDPIRSTEGTTVPTGEVLAALGSFEVVTLRHCRAGGQEGWETLLFRLTVCVRDLFAGNLALSGLGRLCWFHACKCFGDSLSNYLLEVIHSFATTRTAIPSLKPSLLKLPTVL